ncbi:MAG: hypothetical protein KDK97_22295 [Verrucomicrobiales bacterium]|nr:hypothetical protein [Verrucomicrobiales bacterium]
MAAPRPAVPGAGTAPMAGGATAQLPKATVKLQQTQPLARPGISAPHSAPIKRNAAESQQFYDDAEDQSNPTMLAGFCTVLAVAVMAIQMFAGDRVSTAVGSGIQVPPHTKVEWESQDPLTGVWTNKFDKVLPSVPQ